MNAPSAPTRPLWQSFLTFLAPMLLSNVLQAMSGTINNIYVGQMLGVGAMAAVASLFPILFFFIAFAIGLGSGASVLIGQAWGAREPAKVKAIAGTTLCAGMIFGLGVAVLGGLYAPALLARLGTPADILQDATDYARIMFIGMPALFLFLMSTAMMRGVGDTLTPLITLIISTLIGLVVTPALIQGWGGLPRQGAASGGWAMLISMACASVWMVWYLRRGNHALAPDAQMLRHFRITPSLLKQVLRVGLPTSLFMVTSSLADLALLSVVHGYGSGATAAWGAVNQVMAYVQFPAMSISITASIFAAQAIGARRTERLWPITRTGLQMNLFLTGGLALLALTFARPLTGLFITDTQVVDLTVTLLRITVFSGILFGMASVFSGVMRASGTVLVPTAMSLACIALIQAPVGWALSRQFGVQGVWMAYPITFFCSMCLQALYYGLVWRRKAHRRLV